jgi:hypothetical protein
MGNGRTGWRTGDPAAIDRVRQTYGRDGWVDSPENPGGSRLFLGSGEDGGSVRRSCRGSFRGMSGFHGFLDLIL